MSSQRRNQGRFAPATSDAARRTLMQPVTVWERVWVQSEGSPLKLMKWVRTEQKAQFDESEGDATIDAPLAPLPDEPEGEGMLVDEDDEAADDAAEPADQESGNNSVVDSRATSELPTTPAPSRIMPVTPGTALRTPHPLSMSLVPDDLDMENGLQPVPVPVPMPEPQPEPVPEPETVSAPVPVLDAMNVGDDLGAVAEHHLQEDAPAFEQADVLGTMEVGDGDALVQNGMLVEDVVPLDIGES
ncbi:hypothetical protein BKA62DRAFT_770437 [Auriculariales sp. MPI-PUGE-AT-0066]|nr:hypothetical protein BKA62DRAFT_770437 [Auriculariales sp. MPI-PUGE-AT-0066]